MAAAVVGDRALLPLLNTRHPSAVDREWSGEWVAVGFAEQLASEGDLLPATIGWHGAHVRRLVGGTLGASLNARPFGGCFAVPSHCASTQNISCAHLGCAFSKDPDVLTAQTDPDGRGRRQFVGDRPDRAVDVPVRSCGSLLFVSVTTDVNAPWDPGQAASDGLRDEVADRVAGPVVAVPAGVEWTAAASWVTRHVDRLAAGRPVLANVDTWWPNVVVVRLDDEVLCFVARPEGSTRSKLFVAALVQWGSDAAFGERGLELLRGMSEAPR